MQIYCKRLLNVAEPRFRKHSGKPYAFSSTSEKLQRDTMAKIERNDKIIKANLGKTTPNLSEAIKENFGDLELKKEIQTLFNSDNFKI
ncbi:hypothetical protein OFN98_02165 [Campylobacter sp. JMF_15 NE4]|uniref:hypothetical protein n=1 Tax=Campylobacter sp. JMF_15 NE4 TaxID=2983825 RepID=UPI0022E9CE22|nr:hypothetical protein [Campylobacter sp. JMF_15 NE4]MDA3049173.1 hypothetical protein [Campylobacter sp. JMF_15 NE4]MDA3074453.1 hypothetical protein [Campylobacter sp. JMF_05 ED3]